MPLIMLYMLLFPIAVLADPVVLLTSDSKPKEVLYIPVVVACCDEMPIAVL